MKSNFGWAIHRVNYQIFYMQHFYKQCQAEVFKKLSKSLSNTLRLNFRFQKISRFLHPRYYPKILRDIRKIYKKQVSVLIRLQELMMKTRLDMKYRSQRPGANRTRPRHGQRCTKYEIRVSIIMVKCIQIICIKSLFLFGN